MTRLKLLGGLVIVLVVVVTGDAWAAKEERMGKEMKGADSDRIHMMMKERYHSSHELIKMLRETMQILKDLNHKPSAAEKEKLGKMIGELDDMLARHEEMAKRYREKHKESHPGRMMEEDMEKDDE